MRVIPTTVLGYLAAVQLPPLLGIDPKWGTAGLTASAGVAGWVEFVLLRRTLNTRLGDTGLAASLTVRLWAAAAVAAALAWAIKLLSPAGHPIVMAALVLTPYGLGYLGMTVLLKVPEAKNATTKFTKLMKNTKKN